MSTETTDPTHSDLARQLALLQRGFEAHSAEERVFQRTVVEQQALMKRVEREVFGQAYGEGLVAAVHRMGVQIAVGNWVLGVIGTATLGTLVAMFFGGFERGPSQ